MQINDSDSKLIDVIADRGEPTTPAERAACDRFLAEYERAYDQVSGSQASGANGLLLE